MLDQYMLGLMNIQPLKKWAQPTCEVWEGAERVGG